ncbi:hypothetical protein ACINLE_19680 [Bacillus sp. z60-18]|uniref:hypothetical protein n=1 Tax=unclassified Bacillus (in: firmicutes) TaxID=185979 RepID=UPI00390C8097
MKMLRVPAPLHELFGKKIAVSELCLTLLFAMGMSSLLLAASYSGWQHFHIWQSLLLAALTIDITGGVIANFSSSTNRYYKENAKARLVFILIHIQPIVLGWLFAPYMRICFSAWGYTVISALFINALTRHPRQRITGAFFAMSGICLLLLFSNLLPNILTILLSLYIFKVIFAFAVDHDGRNSLS